MRRGLRWRDHCGCNGSGGGVQGCWGREEAIQPQRDVKSGVFFYIHVEFNIGGERPIDLHLFSFNCKFLLLGMEGGICLIDAI